MPEFEPRAQTEPHLPDQCFVAAAGNWAMSSRLMSLFFWSAISDTVTSDSEYFGSDTTVPICRGKSAGTIPSAEQSNQLISIPGMFSITWTAVPLRLPSNSMGSLTARQSRLPPTPRIVGGMEAKPHSWPHQVSLSIDETFSCGGSLISNEWVLTAAHCVYGARYVEVVMGAHNIRKEEATQVTMTSTNFIIHEKWNIFSVQNDIAVIKLPSPVTFNAATTISTVLRQVTVYVMSNADCQETFGTITNDVVCTKSTGGRGTCLGDSGGPINVRRTIHGITSYVSSNNCETGDPNRYVRVYHYLDWIQSKTGVSP
ncbi:Chymotrypsin BII [Chionoecetes opilio]|uniref:Chymotrypsin BII n=1 Tax=Chionoecetes opilio TaxID=41210 RepID=A0A8J4XL88_CHIOP|nr:Chymotrypsin BII [Chionoecetes opilio]